MEVRVPPVDISSVEPVPNASGPSLPATPRLPRKTLAGMDFGNLEVAPPTLRDRAVLVRMDSIEAGRIHTLDAAELRIGRMTGNEVVVDDSGISRSHARLYRSGNTYVIEDLGSSNGTYVNGVRVTVSEVAEGSVLGIGPRARFRFSVIDRHQERMLRQLYEASVRDPLTGIFNRAYFEDRLGTELAYSKRHGTVVSLLFIDIDFFKKVNDTYGHPAGDAVLKSFTATTFASLRTEDLLARYGGEEFAVLLRGINIQNARHVAERLRQSTSEMAVELDGQVIRVTISVGAASTACTGVTDRESLLAAADRRLYIAKNGGRNTVVTSG